jgi:protoheme IX farnesyltransferase
MIPAVLGGFGMFYIIGALIAGCVFLFMGVRLAIDKTSAAARRLLLTSVLYLPVLLALMVVDKVR